MQAKTIFLTEEETIIYESKLHNDNHDKYKEKYYSNLEVTDYLPILLSKLDNCVIDLSKSYQIGVIYLPICMTNFQKDYFNNNKEELEKYKLYLNGHSLEDPINIDELISLIDFKITKPKQKKLTNN